MHEVILSLLFPVLYRDHFTVILTNNYSFNLTKFLSQACFNQWAATKGVGKVTCVMCRQPWQGDGNAHEALAKGEVGDEGYVNVGSQLGMSGYRGA